MLCRIVFAIFGMLLAGASRSPQQTRPFGPPSPASPVFGPVKSAEMDTLASKVAEKIGEQKLASAVVVGGAGPENKVSALGASLRDGLNDALTRQAVGFRVISMADINDTLKRNRVSAGMIYCNLVSDWLAAHAQADTAIVIELERLEDGKALITVEIRDERKKIPADKQTRVAAVSYAKIAGEIPLTDQQISSRTIQYQPALSVLVSTVSMDTNSMPKCIQCPFPDYTKLNPRPKLHGMIYAAITVLPDGSTTDVWIVGPIGFGLDPIAVNTLLAWKLRPGVDGQKRPVATRVPIELAINSN
jgi:hypothetical protein